MSHWGETAKGDRLRGGGMSHWGEKAKSNNLSVLTLVGGIRQGENRRGLGENSREWAMGGEEGKQKTTCTNHSSN